MDLASEIKIPLRSGRVPGNTLVVAGEVTDLPLEGSS